MSQHIFADAANKRFAQNQYSRFNKKRKKNVVHHSGTDKSFISDTLGDPAFSNFAAEAYAASDGYSIRINPATGEKEMFVAGTRDAQQWGLNALDTALYGADSFIKGLEDELDPLNIFKKDHNVKFFEKIDAPRQATQKRMTKVAKDSGVERVYGHSRGGAIVADMKFSGDKVGLDSAQLLANNKDMVNYYEGGGYNPLGLFDEGIGFTGKDNRHLDLSTWSVHKTWAT